MQEQFGLIASFMPLVIVLILMYFMIFRPQQKQQKRLSEMRSNLKVGDRVVTIGGVQGKVTKVGDTNITIETGNGTRIDFVKTAIASSNSNEVSDAE